MASAAGGSESARDLGFDPRALRDFLHANVDGAAGEMRIERIGGGQSNPTYFVTFPERRLVLRKQPASSVLVPGAHAVDREYRVMTALQESGVPVPRTVLFHADADVVGTPFYVMERLEGRVLPLLSSPGPAPDERRETILAMAETLAKLHRVDWNAVGLGDYGRVGGYFRRQIDRFSRQWAASSQAGDPAMRELVEWLGAHVPPNDDTAIAHGDFRVGNLMFHPREPRIVGVLDWELSTLGHPLSDLGFGAVFWRLRPGEFDGVVGLDREALGIPSEEEYLARYFASAPREDRVEPFHHAFSLFRFAVIAEGIAAREREGIAVGADAAAVGRLAPVFVRRASEMAGLVPASH